MSLPSPVWPQLDDAMVQFGLATELPVRGVVGEINCSDWLSLQVLVKSLRAERYKWLAPLVTIASNGFLAAPVSGSVLADTGPLEAGEYDIELLLVSEDNNALNVNGAHRNSTNSANVGTPIPLMIAGDTGSPSRVSFAQAFAADERFRIQSSGAPSGGSYTAAAILYSRRL